VIGAEFRRLAEYCTHVLWIGLRLLVCLVVSERDPSVDVWLEPKNGKNGFGSSTGSKASSVVVRALLTNVV